MSRIDDLLAALCPEGVEFKAIGDVAEIKRGTPTTKASGITGNIPVIAGGRTPAYFHNVSNREGQTIVIAGSGAYAGFVSWWEQPIFVSDAFSIKPKDNLLAKYCYHWLVSMQQKLHELKSGGGVPHVYPRDVATFRVPVPPLEVQRAIVTVLDAFTELEAELEAELKAELEARRQQYQHYRDALLTFADRPDVPWATLGEVAEFLRGTAITEKNTTDGEIPVVANGPKPIYFHNRSNRHSETIVIARSGAYSGLVSFWNQPIFLTDAFSVHPDTKLLKPKFVYYFLRNLQESIHAMKKGSGVPHVRVKEFELLKIPVPSLDEQARIVGILDRFDALVNDLSSGLPAEIAARRQQYEFYRDRLLTFRELRRES